MPRINKIGILSAPTAKRVADAYFDPGAMRYEHLNMPYHPINITGMEDTPYEVRVTAEAAYKGRFISNYTGTVRLLVTRPISHYVQHGHYDRALTRYEGYVQNVTYDRLYRTVAHRIECLYELLPVDLLEAREAVRELGQRKRLPPEIRETADALGHPTQFHVMSFDTCAYWMQVLAALPDRQLT